MFKRPDGIALPECGYHLEDWIDAENDTGIEFDLNAELSTLKTSAEVL